MFTSAVFQSWQVEGGGGEGGKGKVQGGRGRKEVQDRRRNLFLEEQGSCWNRAQVGRRNLFLDIFAQGGRRLNRVQGGRGRVLLWAFLCWGVGHTRVYYVQLNMHAFN